MADEDPGQVIAAGDWHGNTAWALHVIGQARTVLAAEKRRLILHAGDFGIWPGDEGADYLFDVSAALDQAGMQLWFVDGNHEDHPRLEAMQARLREAAPGWDGPIPVPSGSVVIAPRIFWLQRGLRWTWHDRTWLALGGAASVDRADRTPGADWWPGEVISDETEQQVIAGGHADVMLAHDCPAGVKHTFGPVPATWADRDLALSDAHRERVQRIVDAVQPSHLIHGHLHRSYSRECDFGYGPVQVTGLDCDPHADDPRPRGNWAVLDTVAMTWVDPG